MTPIEPFWPLPPTTAEHRWAIVLAGGSGVRLQALTKNELGVVVPKQYCSFRGNRSLLADALARAACLAPVEQIIVVVAQEHERYWRHELVGIAREQIVVQPRNCGTAAGVLLPLSVILDRDRDALVTVLPADHFVADEHTLRDSLRAGQRLAEADPSRTLLVGIEPEHEYGWILPDRDSMSPDVPAVLPVASFIEKPSRMQAAALWLGGAVWNSFFVIAKGGALRALIEQRLPALAIRFAAEEPHLWPVRAERLYEQMPSHDFSSEVLAGSVQHLGVLVAQACGWTDLGTPRRVVQCMQQVPNGLPGTMDSFGLGASRCRGPSLVASAKAWLDRKPVMLRREAFRDPA